MRTEKDKAYRFRGLLFGLLMVELLFWGAYAAFHFAIAARFEAFRYAYPEALWGLYFLPVLPLAFIASLLWKRKALARFGEWPVFRDGVDEHAPKKDLASHAFFRIAIGLLLMALAQPQMGTEKEEAETKGFDLMVCLDLSNSMNAEDIRPSRLEKAKNALEKLLDRLHGDRIGIVVFGGEAYVQVPITSDLSATRLFLDQLTTEAVPTQGTSIAKAIEQAHRSFDEKSETRKAIIVISDGENHLDDPVKEAERVAEKGVIVHTVGMGTREGGPIPEYENGRQIGYKKDRSGQTVVSKLDESMLQETAKAGNGSYVRANNTRVGLDQLMDELDELERKTFDKMVYTEHAERFQLFLWPGAFFLLLSILLGVFPKNLFLSLKR